MTDLRTLSYAELARWLRDDVAPKPAIIREEAHGSKHVALASSCVEDIEALAKELERRAALESLPESELATLMRDPLYWRDRDPEIVRRVTEGFRRLYPPKLQSLDADWGD